MGGGGGGTTSFGVVLMWELDVLGRFSHTERGHKRFPFFKRLGGGV